MTSGDRVVLPDRRAGWVIGWRGLYTAIVALDEGPTVEVAQDRLARAREKWDNGSAEYSGASTITHNARRPRPRCTRGSGALAISEYRRDA